MKTATTPKISPFFYLANAVFIILFLLFLMDVFSPIDIKGGTLRKIVLNGLMWGSLPLSFANMYWLRNKSFVSRSIIPALWIFFLVVSFPMTFYISESWKTQTIEYQHAHFSNKKVEFQMRDKGALGYSRRTVEVFYISPYFMISYPVANDIDKLPEWIKVDEHVNELGLKGG